MLIQNQGTWVGPGLSLNVLCLGRFGSEDHEEQLGREQQRVSAKTEMHSSDCPNPLGPESGGDDFIAILLLFIDQAFLAQRLLRRPLALCIVFH